MKIIPLLTLETAEMRALLRGERIQVQLRNLDQQPEIDFMLSAELSKPEPETDASSNGHPRRQSRHKKVHWTTTPAGRARLSKIMRDWHAAHRKV